MSEVETSPKTITWKLGKEIAGKRYWYAYSDGIIYSTQQGNIAPSGRIDDYELIFPVSLESFIGSDDRTNFIALMKELFPELTYDEVADALAIKLKKGGRISSALKRDRKYTSEEPWEKNYQRAGRRKFYKEEGGEYLRGGNINSLIKKFEKDKPSVALYVIADGVVLDFMRKKHEDDDFKSLSNSEKEKYNEDFRANKRNFEEYLVGEFVKLYYSDKTARTKVGDVSSATTRDTIVQIEKLMNVIAKTYDPKKYVEGGEMGHYDEEKYASVRDYLEKLITSYLGPQNDYPGSADWGGIPVWSVKGGLYEGTFVAMDDDDSVVLMTRHFDKKKEEHVDKNIMKVEAEDEVGLRKLLAQAKEMSDKLAKDGEVGEYEIELGSAFNPDNYDRKGLIPVIKSHKVKVSSLREASQVGRKFIEDENLGGGDFDGGNIWKNGKPFAHMSYNGRIWEWDGGAINHDKQKEIKLADGGGVESGLVVINHGGDRYDMGLVYEVQRDGKRIGEGLIDGDSGLEFEGKHYDGLISLAKGINAKLIVQDEEVILADGGGLDGKKYYALYDTQANRYMASGLNSRSLKKLKSALLDYISSDMDSEEEEDKKALKEMAEMEIRDLAEMHEFEIEEQDKPFEDAFEKGGDVDPDEIIDDQDFEDFVDEYDKGGVVFVNQIKHIENSQGYKFVVTVKDERIIGIVEIEKKSDGAGTISTEVELEFISGHQYILAQDIEEIKARVLEQIEKGNFRKMALGGETEVNVLTPTKLERIKSYANANIPELYDRVYELQLALAPNYKKMKKYVAEALAEAKVPHRNFVILSHQQGGGVGSATIDATPSWSALMPVLVDGYAQTGKQQFLDEILHCAQVADLVATKKGAYKNVGKIETKVINGKEIQTIDMTPNWVGIFQVPLEVYVSNTGKIRSEALGHLMQMANVADMATEEMAGGGRIKSALNRDRKYFNKSQKHEVDYKKKIGKRRKKYSPSK